MRREKPLVPLFSFPPSKIVSIGVDWLTCTQYRASDVGLLKEEIERVIYKQVEEGNDELKWRGQGYYGRRSGGASVGIREDTYIAILTSDCAKQNWQSVGQWATNCSRLDVQVTLELEQPDPTIFDRLEAHLCFLPARRGRPVGVCRVRDNKGGNTIYVGSRSSDWYMRIYDKGVESKTADPGKLIRVEVERKRHLAKRLLARLIDDDDPERTIFDGVCSDLAKLSVSIGLYINSSLEVARVDSISDSKRRLEYLRNCVKPIISKLEKAGFGSEAIAILFDLEGTGDVSNQSQTFT